MRQRNIKNLDERMEKLKDFLVENPEEMKGKWREAFGREGELLLEIGCGKGQFIIKHALNNPQKLYVAVEGQSNVLLRALEKARDNNLDNILFIRVFVENAGDMFEKGEVDKVYLNFSDPWPKERHYKRRLTYRKKLESYFDVMKDDGEIEFKTDNDGLFEFSMNEIKESGFEILEYTEDLHSSSYESKNITTEYEDKFSLSGKNINYVKFRKGSR